MGNNLGKFQVEHVKAGHEPEPGGNLDKVAAEFAEKIRVSLAAKKKELTESGEKESQEAMHLNKVNPEDLTHEDLMIYHKFANGVLREDELKSYRERLRNYFNEIKTAKKRKGEEFNPVDIMNNSRSNLMAMIWHIFQNEKINKKLRERRSSAKNNIN